MSVRKMTMLGCLPVLLASVFLAFGQEKSSPVSSPGIPAGIVWHGVLQDGLTEARETGRPILLISAAPQCAGVSGMW